MPKFVFKLSPVLKMRIREERACQSVVHALERARLQLESRIQNSKMQMDEELVQLRSQLIGKADIKKARFQAHATTRLIHRTDDLVRELAGIYTELKLARAKLMDASSRRCAIEILLDQKLSEWRKSCLAREQMELDEMTSARCFRSD